MGTPLKDSLWLTRNVYDRLIYLPLSTNRPRPHTTFRMQLFKTIQDCLTIRKIIAFRAMPFKGCVTQDCLCSFLFFNIHHFFQAQAHFAVLTALTSSSGVRSGDLLWKKVLKIALKYVLLLVIFKRNHRKHGTFWGKLTRHRSGKSRPDVIFFQHFFSRCYMQIYWKLSNRRWQIRI